MEGDVDGRCFVPLGFVVGFVLVLKAAVACRGDGGVFADAGDGVRHAEHL